MRLPWSRAAKPMDSATGRASVLAAAATANLAVALFAGAQVTAVVCLAIVAAGHYRSWRGRTLRRRKRGQFLLFLLLLGCLAYLGLDLGYAFFGGALPQAKFAMMAQAVTSFDLKTRRNLYSTLWHSLVILYIGALFAWSVAFLPVVLVWLVCLWAFMAFTREPASTKALSRVSSPGEAAMARLAGIRHRRGLIARYGIAWLVVGGISFVTMPRYSGRPISAPLLLAVPLQNGLQGEALPAVLPLVGSGSSGGGASINLRVRGRLGDEVAFRVRAPAASYWRAYVLDRYDGQSWTVGRWSSSSISPISTNVGVSDEDPTVSESLPQTFYIEQTIGNSVLASYPIRELYFPAGHLTVYDSGTVAAPGALRRGTTYAVVSIVRDLSPAKLRQAADLSEQRRTEYPYFQDLQLPDNLPARIKTLADGLASGETTEFDKVAAIADYLRTHYRYSLDTPRLPSGADAVNQFLFVDRVGFCEQFASALAVMLREEGIPARLAIGYATGEHDIWYGGFTVRARDAHAWVEVLFPGVGWVPFDASPGYQGEPIANTPARWFLSDFNPSSLLIGGASLPDARGAVGGLVLFVIASAVIMLVGRRRPIPEVRDYLRAQALLRATGLPVRTPSQTPAEHLESLARSSARVARALAPFTQSVEHALFGRPGRVSGAGRRGRLRRLASAAIRHRIGGSGAGRPTRRDEG